MHAALQDTTMADAPAITLHRTTGTVGQAGAPSMTLSLPSSGLSGGTTAWVHVDLDRDGRVSPGDLLSVESYPVPPGTRELTVRVRRV